jgi:four helix bundle protein
MAVGFEELIAWQKARVLTVDVYRAACSGTLARDYGLRDQMQRAAVSVMSNIAEGHERCSPAEFLRFLRIAKASCAELRSQLYVASDVGHLPDDVFRKLLGQAVEVGKVIGGLARRQQELLRSSSTPPSTNSKPR